MNSISRILAQSTNFLIHHEYETVYLTFKNSQAQDVVIGDFYGDPHTAYIADDESYCAVGGYGLIIYYLAPPFNPYFNGIKNKNWKELYREKADTYWIETIYSMDFQQEIRFVVDLQDELRKGLYRLNLQTFETEKLL
jgi:hypothetical protein